MRLREFEPWGKVYAPRQRSALCQGAKSAAAAESPNAAGELDRAAAREILGAWMNPDPVDGVARNARPAVWFVTCQP
jgi:hypothetical protein